MRALFIGAGLNLKVISVLKNVKDFVLVDIKPHNVKGFYYDKTFISELKEQMKSMDYSIVSEDVIKYTNSKDANVFSCFHRFKKRRPGLIVFSNGTVKVYYFYSVCFPYDNLQELDSKIQDCDVLICGNHDPHNSILDLMKLPIMFVGILDQNNYKTNVELVKANISTFHSIHEDQNIVYNYTFFKLVKNEQSWNNMNQQYRRKLNNEEIV